MDKCIAGKWNGGWDGSDTVGDEVGGSNFVNGRENMHKALNLFAYMSSFSPAQGPFDPVPTNVGWDQFVNFQ